MKHWPQARKRQTKARAYWRERDHCGWTGKPTISQEDQPQTPPSTHQISRYPERWITDHSPWYVIFVWNVFRLPTRLLRIIVSFYYIYISQASVATPSRCGGMFTTHLIANCPENVNVKKLWKSVNIWQRYGQYHVGRLLDTVYKSKKNCYCFIYLW